jgi:hypothetical protein
MGRDRQAPGRQGCTWRPGAMLLRPQGCTSSSQSDNKRGDGQHVAG